MPFCNLFMERPSYNSYVDLAKNDQSGGMSAFAIPGSFFNDSNTVYTN